MIILIHFEQWIQIIERHKQHKRQNLESGLNTLQMESGRLQRLFDNLLNPLKERKVDNIPPRNHQFRMKFSTSFLSPQNRFEVVP